MRRLAIVCLLAAVVAGLLVPGASAARAHPAKARHLAGGLPFTGIGLGGTALLGVLMVSGGLLVRRAAVART